MLYIFLWRISVFICNKVLTLMKKSVQLYPEAEEPVLENFYAALWDNKLRKIHLPHSSVFYVRAAIEADTGIRYSLAHVERAMKQEGFV